MGTETRDSAGAVTAAAATAAPGHPDGVFPAFDEHHAPDAALIADCVHCGFCLPTCPTYLLWGEEMDSPRGRIALMKQAVEGQTGLTENVVRHFDQCLGCMACVTACPSGVQYDKLIEATRAQVARRAPRSPADRLFRALLFALFPHPKRLRAMVPALWLYQRAGLRRLARADALARRLPERLRGMEAVLPPVRLRDARSHLPAYVPAADGRAPRRRVGLLAGCVQQVFFDSVNAATIRVLAAEGCDVVVPAAQGCCGALSIHAGREAEGLDYARRLIAVFEAAEEIGRASCRERV